MPIPQISVRPLTGTPPDIESISEMPVKIVLSLGGIYVAKADGIRVSIKVRSEQEDMSAEDLDSLFIRCRFMILLQAERVVKSASEERIGRSPLPEISGNLP